jgi:hypothetical protein
MRAHIALCGRVIGESRKEYMDVNGEDVTVSLELGD